MGSAINTTTANGNLMIPCTVHHGPECGSSPANVYQDFPQAIDPVLRATFKPHCGNRSGPHGHQGGPVTVAWITERASAASMVGTDTRTMSIRLRLLAMGFNLRHSGIWGGGGKRCVWYWSSTVHADGSIAPYQPHRVPTLICLLLRRCDWVLSHQTCFTLVT